MHEVTPPTGYGVAADQTATVTADADTVVSYSGDFEEHIVPATLAIDKTDVDTGVPLSGAVFDVAFDPTDDGSFSDDLGQCTTDGSGSCSGGTAPDDACNGTRSAPPPAAITSQGRASQDRCTSRAPRRRAPRSAR